MTTSEVIIVLPPNIRIPNSLMDDLTEDPAAAEYFCIGMIQIAHYHSIKWSEDKLDVKLWMEIFQKIGKENYYMARLPEQSSELIEEGNYEDLNIHVETRLAWDEYIKK